MTTPIALRVAAALLVLAIVLLVQAPAFACACCSNRGYRHVASEKLDAHRLATIGQIVFGATAQRYVGEGDGEDGLVDGFGSEYTLAVARQTNRMVFTFRNRDGKEGTATLAMPATVSIFEVDPHGDTKDEGLGPSLYKEWTLTAPAIVSGIMRHAGGPRHTISLILHGRGRSCTDATEFTHWTLHIRGPKGETVLFGPLESTAR